MLIVGVGVFLYQFWMRTSKKYVSNFFDKFFKVKRQNVNKYNVNINVHLILKKISIFFGKK